MQFDNFILRKEKKIKFIEAIITQYFSRYTYLPYTFGSINDIGRKTAISHDHLSFANNYRECVIIIAMWLP